MLKTRGVLATKKWRKWILDLHNCTTVSTIFFFRAVWSLLKAKKHVILSVAFTPVILHPAIIYDPILMQ